MTARPENKSERNIRERKGTEKMTTDAIDRRYSKTARLTLCALFAALMAICSWISIPLPAGVPINLGTLGVFLAAGLLGMKYGTISITAYIFLGAVGAPVFAGFRGGPSVIAGPTGGYIVGYLAAALIAGAIFGMRARGEKEQTAGAPSTARIMAGCLAGLAACYALGTVWFIFLTKTGFAAAMLACVIPFLPGDAVKIAAAAVLIKKIRPHIM